MATDPSWILSTCATAAATLLAIVGGFLVAQLIALVSDQHAADARLADAREACGAAQANLVGATDMLRAAAAHALLSDRQLAKLVAVRGTVPAGEAESCAAASALLAELAAGDRAQSISAAVRILADIRQRAMTALIGIVPVTGDPQSWDKFRWQHFRLPANEEEQWRAVYNLIAAQRAIEAREQDRGAGPQRTVSGEIEFRFREPEDAALSGAASGSRGAAGDREVLAAWRQAVRDAQTTSAAADAAVLRRRELIPLTEFVFGVGVLAYLAFAVMLPLAVLATGPQGFSVTSRYLVPASLGVGVLLLIGFFAYLSGKVRPSGVSLLSMRRTDGKPAVTVPAVHRSPDVRSADEV